MAKPSTLCSVLYALMSSVAGATRAQAAMRMHPSCQHNAALAMQQRQCSAQNAYPSLGEPGRQQHAHVPHPMKSFKAQATLAEPCRMKETARQEHAG